MKNAKWRTFFGAVEWEVIEKLMSSFSDPEQKKAFVYACREKKNADPFYSIFTDFPEMRSEENATEIAMREAVSAIRAKRVEQKKEESKEPSEIESVLGELIELGAHRNPVCLWPRRKV